MEEAIVLDFEGRKLVATMINGKPYFRFRDAFEILEYGENVSAFTVVNNPFLPKQVYSSAWGRLPEKEKKIIREELNGKPAQHVEYVTEKGFYRMCMNSDSKKADVIQDKLADVCMSLREYGCYPPPQKKAIEQKSEFILIAETAIAMENLRIEVQAIKERQNEIKTQVDEIPELIGKVNRRLQKQIDDKVSQIDEMRSTLVEFMTAADWVRKNDVDIDPSVLGKLCAQYAKTIGGVCRPDGWFDNKGERLSHSFPSPDTRFTKINKWKIPVMECVTKRTH